MTRLSDIEDNIAETGLSREQVLDFVRLIPSSDIQVVKPMIEAWTEEMRAAGVEIDDKYVSRMINDFEIHGRLMPETILGAPARPRISLARVSQ